MKQKLPWLDRKSKVRVAIIGDIILDEYLDGSVSRISPEAPVPVHLVKGASHSAGGAANAARNISLAGGDADLFGVCGKDEAAKILFDLLKKDHVNVESVIAVGDRPTHRKTRVTSSNHQIVRIDWEKVQSLEEKNQDLLLQKLSKKKFDAILISDYGKGLLPRELLSKIFKYAQENKIPCVVDPKGADYTRYRGCTIMTPNLRECLVALGLDDEAGLTGEELAHRLQKECGLNDILVTMGAQGMVYVPAEKNKAAIFRKAEAKEVYDVSGAGDTVAAILTLGLGANAPCEDLISLSNTAAAIVVGKWGTQAVTQEELERTLLSQKAPLSKNKSKIVSSDEVAALNAKLHDSGVRIVFTNGCFDILHAGHLDYLEKAKLLGDVLVIGVNTDESIRGLKGKGRPIVELDQRLKLLAGLSCVDYVVPFGEATPLRLIEALAPHVLVKGADYNEDTIVGAQFVKSKGGKIQTIELVPGISTSIIVDRIRNH